MERVKCLIIGSGPAGYTAAIYAGRANLQPVLYCGLQMGGQLTQTTTVENFPGYPEGVDGNEMMMQLRQQAERFGCDMRDGIIEKVDFSHRPYVVTTDRGVEVEADTVIIATGASAKYLGLDDEKKYNGMGVSACATCDGFFYRKKTVAVVGGGDTACEEAIYLAQLCKKVYLIVRKPYLRASDVMQKRVFENEKIEVLFEHNTVGLYGEGCPSTASSSPLATSPTPMCSAHSWLSTRRATSEPSTERRAWPLLPILQKLCQASSLLATAPIPSIARPSSLPVVVARPPSKPSATCRRCRQLS